MCQVFWVLWSSRAIFGSSAHSCLVFLPLHLITFSIQRFERLRGVPCSSWSGGAACWGSCRSAIHWLRRETFKTSLSGKLLESQADVCTAIPSIVVASYRDLKGQDWDFEVSAETGRIESLSCLICPTRNGSCRVPGRMPLYTVVTWEANGEPVLIGFFVWNS